MDTTDIRQKIRQIETLIERWENQHAVSGVECDLVLEKLRAIYDQVIFFPRTASAQTLEGLTVPEFLADATDELSPDDTPDIKDYPDDAPHVGEKSENAPHVVEKAENAPYVGEKSEDAPHVVEKPDAAPHDGSSAEKAPETKCSLPELDEIMVKRRIDRRVILSLYENDEESVSEAGISAQPEVSGAEKPEKTPPTERVNPDKTSADETEKQVETPVAEHAKREENAVAEHAKQEKMALSEPEQEEETRVAEAEKQADFASSVGGQPTNDGSSSDRDAKRAESGKTVGESIAGNGKTIADRFAEQGNGNSDRGIVAEKLIVDRPTGLRTIIGLNDRYLLMNDLFGGDAGAYERTIDTLDTLNDFDEAIIHIHENYDWNPDCDGIRLMVELLTRKLA